MRDGRRTVSVVEKDTVGGLHQAPEKGPSRECEEDGVGSGRDGGVGSEEDGVVGLEDGVGSEENGVGGLEDGVEVAM